MTEFVDRTAESDEAFAARVHQFNTTFDDAGPAPESYLPAAPSDPPAEPEGYREAWDRWADAVRADAPVDELRPLWAAVNATLDRHEQLKVLTAGFAGPDCAIDAESKPVVAGPGPCDRSPAEQDDAVLRALEELRYLTECHCHEAWTGRGLHETHCGSDYREDVDTVAAALDAR